MKKKKNKGQIVLHMVFLVLMAVYIGLNYKKRLDRA